MSDRKSFAMNARAVLSGLAFGILLTGSAMTAQAGPPEFDEFPALRTAPDVPLGSVILRRAFPDHPVAAPIADEFPGEVGFPEEGSAIGRSPIVNGRAVSGDSECDKDVDLTSEIAGVVSIAALDTGFCTNADIDSYVGNDGGTYVVQAGGQERIFTLTDVTDPASPVVRSQLYFIRRAKGTYTPDVKAFHQGPKDYIVVGLERTKLTQPCGVLFFDVTDPDNPTMGAQFIGSGWCDVHNVFVETGPNTSDGRYVYVTADNTDDLRVLDIADVANPVEIGRYTAPGANTSNYVHDVTVVDHGVSAGRRVYLSYWDSGLVILDAADVTPGTNPTPLLAPNVIDPGGFLTHHAVPSADGSRVFIQDEFLGATNDEPVQMWNVSDLTNPAFNPTYVDGLELGIDVGVNPAHNLEIRYDIDPTRLYVGWYKLGLRAWDFDSQGFLPNTSPAPPAVYHQVQTEATDDAYSGAWGVRLAEIGGFLYIFQSDRNFGLIVDCEDCAAAPKGTVTGRITDSSTGNAIDGASVVADTGQSAMTDINGDYTLSNVPTGTRTVTASATGFETQQNTNVVVDEDQTTSGVDFALAPSATSGGFGSIKGTVTDSLTGAKLGGVSLTTDTGQSATTNRGGKYTLRDVPEGGANVTATKAGYVTQDGLTVVTAGQTSTLDFPLVPQEP